MTQLFDTNRFDLADDLVTETRPQTETANRSTRHLRSLPTGPDLRHDDDFDARSTQWQLDADTIEIGRRGLAKARAALKDSKKGRKAA